MTELYDVAAIGNAIVDVIAPATDEFLVQQGMDKGAMMLVDETRSAAIYKAMAPGIEASGGSAGNTVAGLASFGGRGAFLGKVAANDGVQFVNIFKSHVVWLHEHEFAGSLGKDRHRAEHEPSASRHHSLKQVSTRNAVIDHLDILLIGVRFPNEASVSDGR